MIRPVDRCTGLKMLAWEDWRNILFKISARPIGPETETCTMLDSYIMRFGKVLYVSHT